MKKRQLLPLTIMGLLLPITGMAQDGAVEDGARLYAEFGCYQCHQYSGAGYLGVPGGAPLVPMRFPREAFIAFIRNPSTPSRMPPYTEKVLSDAEARDIYAYIESLPPGRPKEEIELLNNIIEEIRGGD